MFDTCQCLVSVGSYYHVSAQVAQDRKHIIVV